MYVKIINPPTHGKKVYANRGSARRTTNYLQQEAKEQGQTAVFFSSPAHGSLTADEVVARLDANHRGLYSDEAKFYSLVLSPGATELRALGADDFTLVDFTRQAMDQYARNFAQLQTSGERGEANLVWAAVIHQERKNRGTDEGKQGEPKPGPQTHVHVIVSARDAAQHVTLNPFTTPARFNRVEYEAKVCVDFAERLGATSTATPAAATLTRSQRVREKAQDIRDRAAANRQQKVLTHAQLQAKEQWLDAQVARLNTKLAERNQLDAQRVKAAAQERGHDQTFYRRLLQLTQNVERGKFTPDPHEYLRTGLVQRGATGHPPSVASPPTMVQKELARPARPQLPTSWQLLAQVTPAVLPTLSPVPHEPAVRRPEVVSLPTPTAVEAAATAARPLVPADEVFSPAPPPLSSPLALPGRVPVEEPAVVEQLGGNPERLAATSPAQQQVDATALAGEHQVVSAALPADQGPGPSAASQPDGVRHQANGGLVSPAEVLLPSPPAAEANSLQHGWIVLVDEPGQPAAERLEKWRPYLSEVGVTTGQVVPATAREPAHLSYSFNVQQADLDRVADRLNKLQAISTARMYEAPHVLHTPAGRATGLAVAPAQWPEREGQFSQASFVVTGTSPERVAAQAARIQAALGRLGAVVGTTTPAGPGELEWRVTYHTRSPHIEELDATLEGAARITGVTLRESDSQQFARLAGVREQERNKRDKPGFQREH